LEEDEEETLLILGAPADALVVEDDCSNVIHE